MDKNYFEIDEKIKRNQLNVYFDEHYGMALDELRRGVRIQ